MTRLQTRRIVEEAGVSPTPLYHQVLTAIREQIKDGSLKPGQQLPSETELCKDFRVSRGTLRRAIDELVAANLVQKRQGVGTFVKQPRIDLSLNYLRGLVEELIRQGHDPEVECIERSAALASQKVAGKLQIREGEPVVYLKRRIRSEDEALALTETYYPYKLCAPLLEADPNVNIFEFLEQELGFEIDFAEQEISPLLASSEVAEALSIPLNSLLFSIEWVAYLNTGQPIFTGWSRLRSDKYTVKVVLHRRNRIL